MQHLLKITGFVNILANSVKQFIVLVYRAHKSISIVNLYTARPLKILTERVGGGVGQVADGRRQSGIVQQDAAVRRRVGRARVGAGRVEVVVSVARVGQTQQVSQVLPALLHAHRTPVRHAALHTQNTQQLAHNSMTFCRFLEAPHSKKSDFD